MPSAGRPMASSTPTWGLERMPLCHYDAARVRALLATAKEGEFDGQTTYFGNVLKRKDGPSPTEGWNSADRESQRALSERLLGRVLPC